VSDVNGKPSTSNVVAIRRSQDMAAAIPAKLQYAQELANSGLLPSQFRRQPGNVLYAVEYGEMLGLSPMAAITGIHVIEGRPSASAGLISALVRRAGHKLRIRGNALSATCQIIRSDDPDYTYEVTWTLKRNKDGNPNAEDAGLLGKDVWKKYGASMLKSRAITQCARDACEEALFGLHYTAEELGAEVDEEGHIIGQVVDEPAPPVQQAPAPAGPEGWDTDEATAEAQNAADMDACRRLWRDASSAAKAGLCTNDEAKRIQDFLKARIEDLQNQSEATVPEAGEPDGVVDAEIVEDAAPAGLDPEDPWSVTIEQIATATDAEQAMNELLEAFKGGRVDETRANRIRNAISAKAAQVADVIEGKVAGNPRADLGEKEAA
jgi:hypothetical protein